MIYKQLKQLAAFAFLAIAVMLAPAIHAENTYTPAKVVYDVSTGDAKALDHLLDRASLLQRVYDNNSFEASIILVIHEDAVPLFAKKKVAMKHQQYIDLMKRAESLTLGEIIHFRICAASAKMQGYDKKDFPAFTRMVPMADAEIIQLQNQGYAYLR